MSTATLDQHAALLRNDPLYLDRCQVDTPPELVSLVWRQIAARREQVSTVVDFGAGDARFAGKGGFDAYLGYEIDRTRFSAGKVAAPNVRMLAKCAFSHQLQDADLCIGNPPYVRNQDLPAGWRQMAADEVRTRTGVTLSGLANAWQYFLMLGLWSVKNDGLVVQILPFDWVSRPAVSPIRQYIEACNWAVDVYRLPDGVFPDVLTAASITVIDKRGPLAWRFHEVGPNGRERKVASASGSSEGVLPYLRSRRDDGPQAKRGLSPGTQQVLTLSEGERVHAGLHVRRDVVRCVTSLRGLPAELASLTADEFDEYFVNTGAKCWLIRTDRDPSPRLRGYLDNVPESAYQTATCLNRDDWWRFQMPPAVPQILIAQAFKGSTPKAVLNDVDAYAVGGVAGIYNVAKGRSAELVTKLKATQLHDRVVPYAKQMCKLEINQMNALLNDLMAPDG